MFIGIFLGGALAVFGLMFGPLLSDYGELVKQTQIAQYQYVLADTAETQNGQAEKYCVTSLDTVDERFMTDEVMIYGIENGSKYVKTEIPSGQVLISNGYAAKYKLSEGDEITLKDKYSSKTYTFTVESYLCDKDSDVYKAVEALQIGDKIDMEGFLYWYNGVNPHITSVTVK